MYCGVPTTACGCVTWSDSGLDHVPGQAEIRQLHLRRQPGAGLREQDVIGLHVAMHDPAFVGIRQRPGHVGEDRQGFQLAQFPPLVEDFIQAPSRHVFEHKVMDSAVFVHLQQGWSRTGC